MVRSSSSGLDSSFCPRGNGDHRIFQLLFIITVILPYRWQLLRTQRQAIASSWVSAANPIQDTAL